MGRPKKRDQKEVDTIREIFNISQQKEGENSRPKTRDGFFLYDDYNTQKGFSQYDVIHSIVSGFDTMAIIATSGGKSLIFQAAALLMEGITIVVSPLVSLIQDQVIGFNSIVEMNEKNAKPGSRRHYRAVYFGMNHMTIKETFEKLCSSDCDNSDVLYKLLYISPEHLRKPDIQLLIREYEENGKLKISQIVIDEAHCYIHWGLSFRDSYLAIGGFINILNNRPVLSIFTATATKLDMEILIRTLPFNPRHKHIFISVLDRPELKLYRINVQDDQKIDRKKEKDNNHPPETPRMKEAMSLLVEYFKNNDENAIALIYCTSKRNLDELYRFLSNEWKDCFGDRRGLRKYYGEMTRGQKEKMTRKGIRIMIATQAFGMGINLNNIRLVIHYDVPNSIEEYVQEIGRAARNGGEAECTILHTKGDENEEFYGSVNKTETIIASISNNHQLENKMILSGLSDQSKDYVIGANIYRFGKVKEFLDVLPNKKQHDPDIVSSDPHEFIHNYLYEDAPYEMPSKMNKNIYYKVDNLISDVNLLLGSIHTIHVNNTALANLLRGYNGDHDNEDNYELNTVKRNELKEWRRKGENNSDRIHEVDIDKDTLFIRIYGNPQKKMDDIRKAYTQYLDKNPSSIPERLIILQVYQNIVNAVFTVNNEAERDCCLSSDAEINRKYMGKKVRIPKVIKEIEKQEREKGIPMAFIKSARTWSYDFVIRAEEKPDYWDLCVADAVYSAMVVGKRIIYVKDIWAVLSGCRDYVFSTTSKVRVKIKESIDKLIDTEIEIDHKLNGKSLIKESGTFLPLKRLSNTGYTWEEIPPLYRYAQRLHGQIIQIPVSFLNLREGHKYLRYKPRPLFMSPKILIDTFDDKVKYTIYSEELELKGEKQFHPIKVKSNEWHNLCIKIDRVKKKDDDNKDQDGCEASEATEVLEPIFITTKTIQWQATQEQAVLTHFILHRIFVSNSKRRGRYINFNTLLSLLENHLTKRSASRTLFLHKKIIAMLYYYHRIGLIRFVGYITDFEFCDNRGNHIKKTAYFRAEHRPVVEYWKDAENECHFMLNDIRLTWVMESDSNPNRMSIPKNNRGIYSNETLSRLDKISVSDLTGVKLLYSK